MALSAADPCAGLLMTAVGSRLDTSIAWRTVAEPPVTATASGSEAGPSGSAPPEAPPHAPASTATTKEVAAIRSPRGRRGVGVLLGGVSPTVVGGRSF